MTPAALRSEAMKLLRQAQELFAQADEMERAPATTATTWISTGRAMQIMRLNSPSSIYRLIERRPDIARRVSGRWQLDEGKLLALLDRGCGENGEASGENGECLLLESPR